jgi:hypothetical protein
MSKYQNFIFKDYDFNKDSKELKLSYSYDDDLEFSEIYKFDFNFVDYDEAALTRTIELLFFMAGVSYYKMYLSPNILVNKGSIDDPLASFLSKTYENGLKEFLYVNKLDLNYKVNFPVNSTELNQINVSSNNGKLIGIGGGKDSLVSVELLRDLENTASWSLNHKAQLKPLIDNIGLSHFWVDRIIDPKVIELNKQDALNGHVPISAIISAASLITLVLSGYRDSVVSNENSANEPTMVIDETEVNHQYSKSLKYEKDLQEYLHSNFNDSLRYYSLLRPYSELRIAEIFSKIGFEKYKASFSSCNRAFRHNEDHMFWCGECPKCAFTFLALTPFIERSDLEELWPGKNLLLDPSLEVTYKQLLGIDGDKPLDCVGEIKESRSAMRLAQDIYPELVKYVFDIPSDYDYKTEAPHSMPEDIYVGIKSKLAELL